MVDDKPKRRWINVIAGLICSGLLTCLILEAIRAPRPIHSAACKNNLRQLALGTQSFHSQKGRLPNYLSDYGIFEAGSDPTVLSADPIHIPNHRKIGTWAVTILAFIDQQSLYEHWSLAKYPIVKSERSSISQPLRQQNLPDFEFHPACISNVSTYRCPASPSASSNSYIANTGVSVREDAKSFGETLSSSFGVFHNGFPGLNSRGEPVATSKRTSLEDIEDGLSQTILFSESLQARPWYQPGFVSPQDLVLDDAISEIRFPVGARFTQGMVWQQLDNDDSESVNSINQGVTQIDLDDLVMTKDNAAQLARPSSLHGGGVNIALADGSVRFLTETIDPKVYAALLSPRDVEAGLIVRDSDIRDALSD